MKWRPTFSLRTLLVATAICGVFFGWIGSTWVRVRHQQLIVAQLQALGCKVFYDYQSEGNHLVDGKRPQGWNPLRWIFGNDVDSSVICIMAASGSRLTGSDLAQLHGLPELLDVDVSAAQITNEGIVELTKIRKLRSLSLNSASTHGKRIGTIGIVLTSCVIDALGCGCHRRPAGRGREFEYG